MAGKHETCVHVMSVGQYAVYVDTGCPRAMMVRGTLIGEKRLCRGCGAWEGRDENGQREAEDLHFGRDHRG